MAFNLLRGSIEREGFLKKTASAKGKDQVRGKWQERWFVLKGHELSYYKKKGDNTAKGVIDLRAARVDDADATTGKPFTIRIAQSKQVFNYLQASSQEDKELWLAACRKCAGYRMETIELASVAPKTQAEAFCSYGVRFKSNLNADKHDHLVLIADPEQQALKLFINGKILKVHEGHTVAHVQHSNEALTNNSLFGVTVDFKADNYLTRRDFYVGSLEEAKAVSKLLSQVGQANYEPVRVQQQQPVLRSMYVDVQGMVKDGKWDNLHLVVIEKRLFVFRSQEDTVPWRVFFLHDCKLDKDGQIGLILHTSADDVVMRFASAQSRDAWAQTLTKAQRSLKEKINVTYTSGHQYRLSESERKSSVSGSAAVSNYNSDSESDDEPIGAPPSSSTNTASSSSSSAAAPSIMSGGSVIDKTLTAGAQLSSSYLVAWGDNTHGNLGIRTKDNQLLPKQIESLRTKCVRVLSAGASHCAAVTKDGHVYAWGNGADMQLGLGEARKQSSSPYLVTSLRAAGSIVHVACGRAHTLALSEAGVVWSWGSGSKGQLGQGDHSNAAYPQQLKTLGQQQVAMVAAGGDSSAVLTRDKGQVFMWGANDYGQLGVGHTTNLSTPSLVPALAQYKCVSVSCGADFSAAITDDHRLFTWGHGAHGKLGLGHESKSSSGAEEVAFFSQRGLRVTQVALGDTHAVALVEGGTVFSWGQAMLNCHKSDRKSPVELKAVRQVRYVCAGPTHSLLIDDQSRVFAFGRNKHGQLGNGNPTEDGLVETCLSSKIEAVAGMCGDSFSIVLASGSAPDRLESGRTAGRLRRLEQQQLEQQQQPNMRAFNYKPDDPRGGSGSMDEAKANDQIAALLSAVQQHEAANNSSAAATATTDDGQEKEKKKKKKKKGKWKQATDPNGKVYYYHTKTRETSWTKPDDMK